MPYKFAWGDAVRLTSAVDQPTAKVDDVGEVTDVLENGNKYKVLWESGDESEAWEDYLAAE